MKASCIIPVYNAEKTLRRCVESVVYGEEWDVEVILVEDCSKDGSWELCRKLSVEFSNVHSFRNPKNSGVSYSRNHGLQEAKGEYVLFVDSDDWVSGRYASTLLATARKYTDVLIMSGFRFCDDCTHTESVYILDSSMEETFVEPFDYFRLVDATLIQALWNKVFRREIIEQAKIRFDETQSMGEDFQFVLDYLRASKVRGCQVLNTPLYYYIRANGSSLMSQFGISDFEASRDRLEQLAEIGCIDCSILDEKIQNQRQCNLYFIARYPKFNKAEKLQTMEQVMGDGRSKVYYRKQQRIMLAEHLMACKGKLQSLPGQISGKLQRNRQQKLLSRIREQVKATGFSVIAQNCIGGVLYHDLQMQFLSPTINLYFTAADFSRFVLNMQGYLNMELQMSWKETYPVGHLGDISIYFQHYLTCSEAKEAWNRRKLRINWDKIIVVSTDHEGFNADCMNQWEQIPYPKLLFTSHKEWKDRPYVLYFPEYEKFGCVKDLISGRDFYRNDVLMQKLNSL